MQTSINKPLQDLLQTAQFVTPSGGDTVAAKYAQAAQQKMQAQAMPPGIEALMPGVKQQAMMSAQAAQPATQGDVNQLRQMMAQAQQAQAQQGQGIAAGADVQMAEGGIVGYAGPDGSDVELDVTGKIKKALRDWYERTERGYMERAGATPEAIAKKLNKEPSVTPAPIPEGSDRRLDIPAGGVVSPGMVRTAPAPRPPVQRPPAASPAAAPAAPMLPDTREPTTVNPSESALMYAQMQGGLKELLERQGKPRERTPEELKEAAAREEEIKRRMGEIDASKARFEQAKQERLAGQQGQGLRDLASFLARAGGARSGLAGLSEAQLGMEPVLAARSTQEQKFREQELAFIDKLGERRDLVTDMRLASLKDDAGRAREDAARIRTLDMEISKLGLGLGEKRAGELARAELSREEAAGRAKEGALDRASREKVARMGLDARAAGAGALTPRDIARFRAQAEKDVDAQLKTDPKYVSMKVRDPAGAETYRTKIIDERLKRVLAEEGFGTAAPAPAPAAGQLSPEVLSQFKVRPVGQ